MRIEQIQLINFRNYEKVNLDFEKGINLICGDNGQGKTNIVEAINYLTLGKSFKTTNEIEMIRYHQEYLKINLSFFNHQTNHYQVIISQDSKKINYNDYEIKKLSELSGKLISVLFVPEDVLFFKTTPNIRRRFLDINISSFNKNYLYVLMKFKNDLKERNALLKNDVVDKTLLDIITKRMIEEQYEIFIERQKTINELNRYLVSSYSSLDGETKIELKYCSLILEQEKEKYCQTLEKLYFDEFEHELKRKTTLIGIHHDDLKIFLDGREIGVYGSQGQNRLSSLALKLAMVSLIKEKIKQDPIIILDDVLSELDAIHQEKLIKTLNGYEQVFITYAKQDLKIPNSTTFVVEDNRITRR